LALDPHERTTWTSPGTEGTAQAAGGEAPAPATGSISSGSIAWLLLQVGGNAALFVGVLIIARVLGPEGRGSVAFLTVSAQVMGYLAPLGVSEATLVFAAKKPDMRPKLLANLLLAASAGAVIAAVLLVGLLAAVPALRPTGVGTVELFSLGLATMAAATAQSSQQFTTGCGLFRQQAIITVPALWLYPLVLLTIWGVSKLTVANATVAWAAALGISAVGSYTLAISKFGITRPAWSLLGESLRFGSRAWIGSLARFLNFRVDQLLVAFIASEVTLGIYAAAVNFSEVLLFLPVAAGSVLVPFVAQAGAHGRPERTLHVVRGVLLLTCVSAVVAAVVGPLLLPLLFGPQFNASVMPFLLLLPGAFGFVFIAIFSGALIASSSPGLSSLGALVALAVGVVLDFALIPAFGASGAAAAASVALIAGGAAALTAYRSRNAFAWRSLVPGWEDAVDIVHAARRLLGMARKGSP
jgi:O-antigen/teichoic acid export membrane protein